MSDARQHTSIAEMARECAEHKGSMIVDIEIEPSGRERIHAVATWEPAETLAGAQAE